MRFFLLVKELVCVCVCLDISSFFLFVPLDRFLDHQPNLPRPYRVEEERDAERDDGGDPHGERKLGVEGAVPRSRPIDRIEHWDDEASPDDEESDYERSGRQEFRSVANLDEPSQLKKRRGQFRGFEIRQKEVGNLETNGEWPQN